MDNEKVVLTPPNKKRRMRKIGFNSTKISGE